VSGDGAAEHGERAQRDVLRDRAERGDRMGEALAHLQVAALELIEAARAALDVAEDLVREPAAALLMAGLFADVVGAAQSTAKGWPPDQGGPAPGPPAPDGTHAGARGHVQRVRVSRTEPDPPPGVRPVGPRAYDRCGPTPEEVPWPR